MSSLFFALVQRCRLVFLGGMVFWLVALGVAYTQNEHWWITYIPVITTLYFAIWKLTEPAFVTRSLVRSISRLRYLITVALVSMLPLLFIILQQPFIPTEGMAALIHHSSDFILFWSLALSLLIWRQPIVAIVGITYPLFTGLFPMSLLTRYTCWYHFVTDPSPYTKGIQLEHLRSSYLTAFVVLTVSFSFFLKKDVE